MKFGRFFFAFVVASIVLIDRVGASPIVHPGDTLSIDVLNYSSVIDDSGGRYKGLEAGNVVVAADGSISVPVVGTLQVAGKSTHEVAALLQQRLATYVRSPAVNVDLIQQGQQIFLTGATIGTLPYLPGETLSSALGQLRQQLEKDEGAVLTTGDKNGGTLTRTAIDLRSIVIDRDGHSTAPFDGELLLQNGSPGPTLQPDDTIRFASKPVRVEVRGEVAAPGAVFLYPSDTLEQALQQAGGALGSASTADASLIRDGKEMPLPLSSAALRQVPENGDTIIVRAAPHVTVIGQVPTPGEYTLKNGTTLLSALYISGGPTKWANVRDIQVIHDGNRTTYDLAGLQHGDLSSNIPLVDGDVVYVPEGHKIDASLFLQAIGAALGAYDASRY